MNDPIPINKSGDEQVSTEELLQLDAARHSQRIQWVFLGLLAFIAVGLLTPLFVWLVRLALGG
jgi:hypothetical protein